MKLTTINATIVVLLGLIPGAGRAQDFSADVVYGTVKSASSGKKTSSPSRPSKLFVSKDKIRLETRGVTDTILLADAGDNTAFALFPAHKMYQPLANAPAQYFRVTDAENACPDWQKASSQKIVCEKVGHETVDGRDAVKYQNNSTGAEVATTAVWIDPALHFVIKWEGTDASAELRDIHEAAQPADLFAVPANYEMLKPTKKTPKAPPK